MPDDSLFIRLHPDDNIMVARTAVPAAMPVDSSGTRTVEAIPAAHKVATRFIAEGAYVLRYGQIIGVATAAIHPGELVHVHNLAMAEFGRSWSFADQSPRLPAVTGELSFMGIRRDDGRVATRNYIGIVSTVNCSATVAKRAAQHFDDPSFRQRYPNIDGVVALTHSFGCCIDHGGEGLQQLRRTLEGYLTHVNFAGVILIGLGCEANQIAGILNADGKAEDGPVRLVIQDVGGTQKTIDAAIAAVENLAPKANDVARQPAPLSHLSVALQCGGSDGYSGITANPALGAAVDLLVAHGGTAILSETPEIYGAEHLLARRAINGAVADKLLERIRWWESYAVREQGSIDNNPTPGNKAGGLTTILEKSLGAVAKSGSTALTGVYRYAEPIDQPGLVFMDAPGYDPIGATGQVASGANLIAFTTGRGSCFGAKPVPSVKIATNTAMFDRMRDDMDINCGSIMDGNASVADKGREIFEALIRVASGEKTKSEIMGLGDHEFVPWMIGAQM